jgi:adenine-specific DNA-methyltransferase
VAGVEIPRGLIPTGQIRKKCRLGASYRQQRDRQVHRAKAEFEYLYDKPYADNKKVTWLVPSLWSLSPHRVLGVDDDDELIDPVLQNLLRITPRNRRFPNDLGEPQDRGRAAAHKEDKIVFAALTPWPGALVCAEGRYLEGEVKSALQFL